MPEFSYIATDRAGRTVEGTISADNSALAVGKVRELGFTPERVRAVEYRRELASPVRSANLGRRFAENFIYPVSSGVPLKDLAVFYRQFATMINAGIPLYQALVTLEGQARNPKLAGILRDCQRQVQQGGKLSEVFAAYPWVFSELQIEMIRAAEHGGLLDQMLLRIAGYLEQEMALRRLISRLTLYPKLVVFVALFILGGRFFVDGMPAISKLVVGSMGIIKDYGIKEYLMDTVVILGIFALVVFAIVAFCRIVLFQSDSVREGYEKYKMSLPGLGSVVRGFALAKFGRAFGAMYAAGLPLNTAIRVGGNASGSQAVARATARAILASERGMSLSQSLRETGVFPHIVLDMLHTGEQSGNIDAMMTKVAEYLEGDAEAKAHLYSNIFAIIVLLLVLILCGAAVIRFYMQYASGMSSAVGD